MSSTSRNPDSITPAQGEVHPRVPRSEPLTTKGHAPGVLVGNDAVPTFHAQTLPAGSAPSSNTFKPDATGETPGQANNDLATRGHGKEDTHTSAQDTLTGASSADVHTGLGHPGQGQVKSDKDRKAGERDGGVGQAEVTGGSVQVEE